MTLRPLALTACAVAVALAAPSSAAPAPKPQIVDPKGDSLGPDAGLDIVSGTFSTKGTTSTTKVRGKKVTTYTPTDLVVAIQTAGPITKQAGTTLHVGADIEGCGDFALTYSPDTTIGGDYSSGFVSCLADPDDPADTSSVIAVSPKVAGNVITWTIKLRTFGKAVGVGTAFNELEAYTAPAEPVTGIIDTGSLAGPAVFDSATGGSFVVR